jgi:hypothetical protein
LDCCVAAVAERGGGFQAPSAFPKSVKSEKSVVLYFPFGFMEPSNEVVEEAWRLEIAATVDARGFFRLGIEPKAGGDLL